MKRQARRRAACLEASVLSRGSRPRSTSQTTRHGLFSALLFFCAPVVVHHSQSHPKGKPRSPRPREVSLGETAIFPTQQRLVSA
jgi:hypothetical protein